MGRDEIKRRDEHKKQLHYQQISKNLLNPKSRNSLTQNSETIKTFLC